jgi:hypothetical protein
MSDIGYDGIFDADDGKGGGDDYPDEYVDQFTDPETGEVNHEAIEEQMREDHEDARAEYLLWERGGY